MRGIAGLLLLFVLGAIAAPECFAADRAAAVQAEVEQAFNRLAGLDPSLGLAYGAIEVVPEGAAYNVAVADVAVRLASNDPGYLELGIISFRLSPVGDDLYRVDRFRAADKVAHRAADGRIDGTWEIVNRELSGLWARRQFGFLQRDAAIDTSLAITGLDSAINAIAAAPPQEGSNLRWLQLMLLRGLAQREVDASGIIIDRYDISKEPHGAVVVNGRSLGFLSAMIPSNP
jgi:hypothetical protein